MIGQMEGETISDRSQDLFPETNRHQIMPKNHYKCQKNKSQGGCDSHALPYNCCEGGGVSGSVCKVIALAFFMRASLMHTLHKRCQMFFKVKGLGNGMFSSLQSLPTVSRQKEIFMWLLCVALPSFIPITFVPSFSLVILHYVFRKKFGQLFVLLRSL